MTKPTAPTQGFIAVSWTGGRRAQPDVPAVLTAIRADAPTVRESEAFTTATWGLDVQGFDRSQPLLLSRTARRRDQELDLSGLRRLLAGDRAGLAEVHPTFAAVDHVDDRT